MFRPGSIRKIQLKDFVTYSFVEVFPGPQLNMIIGPNGTGKSTIVGAIILGLGGTPQIVGRGTKVGEYIKHGCDSCTITIHLQGEEANEFVKITRTITAPNKSAWMLNNQTVSSDAIQDCIKQYNIQVDNLCQTLPQDRVQDFAKMNQQQLLRETQRALCRNDFLEKQDELIAKQKEQKDLTIRIKELQDKLQYSNGVKARLEGKVENFHRKKKYMEDVRGIERKMAWLHYDECHQKTLEVNDDVKKAKAIFETHKNKYEPVKKVIEEKEKAKKCLENEKNILMRKIHDVNKDITNNIEAFEESKANIHKTNSSLEAKLCQLRDFQTEIKASEEMIEKMKQEKRTLLEQCQSNDIEKKVTEIKQTIGTLASKRDALKNKQEEIAAKELQIKSQSRAYQQEISYLQNVKEKRMNVLLNMDKDAHRATLWLRENKHLFRGQVFEPILLEMNVLESKNAKYFENIIARRDRVAIGCTDKDDMKLLIKCLREEQRLKINILHYGETGPRNFAAKEPIENLRKFGFYQYMNYLLSAPTPIMNYLCKMYRLYEIPVGTDQTDSLSDQVPNELRLFFSSNCRYSVNFSSYSGSRLMQQSSITSDGTLGFSMDMLRMEKLKSKIAELQQQIDNFLNISTECKKQVEAFDAKIQKEESQMNKFQQVKKQIETYTLRIKTIEDKMKQFRIKLLDEAKLRNEAKVTISHIVKKSKKFQEGLLKHYKLLPDLLQKDCIINLKIKQIKTVLLNKKKESEEFLQLMNDAEKTLSQIRKYFTEVKGIEQNALDKAKNLSNNLTREDEGFAKFRQNYDKLPQDPAKLEKEKEHIFSLIRLLTTADRSEIEEYEANVELIEVIQGNIDKANQSVNQLNAIRDELELEWLTPLKEFIEQINVKFSSAFQRMKCVGEVSLNQGDDPKNYEMYGLCIKVAYRNGQPLQALNNVVQSGGERAVATAVYLLSIQEFSPVPFRCVDEINQGMDAENERRMFNMIIESTDQPDSCQYFLITPKLVSGITYSESLMVHVVNNGPFINPDRKWSFSALCNDDKLMLH